MTNIKIDDMAEMIKEIEKEGAEVILTNIVKDRIVDQKDLPMRVWQNYDKANRPRMVICTKSQLPSTRLWRNSWKINPDCINKEKAA